MQEDLLPALFGLVKHRRLTWHTTGRVVSHGKCCPLQNRKTLCVQGVLCVAVFAPNETHLPRTTCPACVSRMFLCSSTPDADRRLLSRPDKELFIAIRCAGAQKRQTCRAPTAQAVVENRLQKGTALLMRLF